MNKRDYMEKILLLCSVDQRDLFRRMYPEGVSNDKIEDATSKVEKTLIHDNLGVEAEVIKTVAARDENSVLIRKLKEANRRIRTLETQGVEVKIVSNDDLMSALFAEGLDNWDGYEEAMDRLKSNE